MRHIFTVSLMCTAAGVLLTSAIVAAQPPTAGEPQNGKLAPIGTSTKNAEKRALVATKARAVIEADGNELLKRPNLEENRLIYRSIVRAELLFARTTARLTKDQLQRIRPEVEEKVLAWIEREIDPQTGAPATTPAPSLRSVEASARLRAVVQGAVKRHAAPQQSAGLQAAIDRFNADRKEAAVRYIVVALDRHLKLTSPQRAKLTEVFLAHWDDAWLSGATQSLFGSTPLPDIPERLVIPHLSNSQVKTWRRFPKRNYPPWRLAMDPSADGYGDEDLGGQPQAGPAGTSVPEAGQEARPQASGAAPRD
jgi:hypothetical protein